jgi:hypothetical protein
MCRTVPPLFGGRTRGGGYDRVLLKTGGCSRAVFDRKNVRFGSKSEVGARNCEVCFTPVTGHRDPEPPLDLADPKRTWRTKSFTLDSFKGFRG